MYINQFTNCCGMSIISDFGKTNLSEGDLEEYESVDLVRELKRYCGNPMSRRNAVFTMNTTQVDFYSDELRQLGLEPVFTGPSNHGGGEIHLFAFSKVELAKEISNG